MDQKKGDFIHAMLRCSLFHGFSEEELTQLLPSLLPEVRRLKVGEALVRKNEPTERVGVVLSGCLISGSSQMLGTMSLCSLAALFSDEGKSCVTIKAAERTTVMLFNVRTAMDHAQYGDRLKNNVLRALADTAIHDLLQIDACLTQAAV